MPQQQIQLPSNVPPGNQPIRPQLPIQPNLNPNNKGVQQADSSACLHTTSPQHNSMRCSYDLGGP